MAIEAVRNTQSFGRIGVGLRDERLAPETLDRAATRLEKLLGVTVLPLEDHISRAVREHLPARLAPLAPLAPQLDLLGLAGAERARELAETGQVLLQHDGAAAIPLLGAVDCAFPDDLEWAQHVATALANGADRDVRAARETIREADDLMALFPAVSLVEETERDVLHDLLTSDGFYSRLADLRGLMRAVRDRAAAQYRDRLTQYAADVADSRRALEALPEWAEIAPDDRADVAARLDRDLPATSPEGQEIARLGQVLVRLSALAGLRAELQHEVERLVPKVVHDGGPDEPIDLDFSELLTEAGPPPLISSEAELDSWIRKLHAAVANKLQAGAPLRIRVRR